MIQVYDFAPEPSEAIQDGPRMAADVQSPARAHRMNGVDHLLLVRPDSGTEVLNLEDRKAIKTLMQAVIPFTGQRTIFHLSACTLS